MKSETKWSAITGTVFVTVMMVKITAWVEMWRKLLTTEGVVLGVWSLKRVYNFITQMNPTQTSNHTLQTHNTSSLAVVN